MDCAQDLESHDDIARALEKAKESMRLIRKQMFRSHDLLVLYNDKLKECECLKEDLCATREEVIKLKWENSMNLSKMVKLEIQSRDYKKSQQEQEQKIEKNDIQIASDKSHLEQLKCKLESVEEKQLKKEMEAELTRSILEVKVKELEQELKALKKSHQTEVGKIEKSAKSPKEKKGKKSSEVVKETREIGVNTIKEVEQPQPVKPATVNESVMTDEFYHIRDNPYPLFCNRCESFMESKIEKICKIITHPLLVGNISSPIRPRVPGRQHPNHNDSNNLDVNRLNVKPIDLHRNESTRTEINLNGTSSMETNSNESNSINLLSHNFVLPLPTQLTSGGAAQETPVSASDATALERDNLRREVATLKRKLKNRRTRNTSDSQPVNCCTHSHPVNYCGHSSTHANPVPNVFPNMQADLMAEFLNRIMNFANERGPRQKTTKVDSQRVERTFRDKRAKIKSRKLKRMKILKKSRNCGSGNWEINSSDFDAEKDPKISVDPSDPSKPHLLRIKPSYVDDTPITSFSDAASEKWSSVNDPWEASFAEMQTSSDENAEKSSEKAHRPESDSNQESAVKIPITSKPRKRGRPSLIRDDGESEMEVESVKNESVEDAQTNISKNSTRNTRTRSKSLRSNENKRKSLSDDKSTVVQENAANSSWHSAINESGSISLNGNARDLESGIFSQNSTVSESAFDWKEADDADQSDAPQDVYSDSEPLECTNLRDRVEMQKRKRSSSPKAAKSRGRSNLLGKLRALKKNNIITIAKTSNSSSIHATRSLSRRKLTEQSECEDFVVATKANKRTSISTDEPNPYVPVKKQRIAHVPKIASSPQSDEQDITMNSKIFNETCKNKNEKSTDDCMVAVTKRRLTRRLAIEKLAQSKFKNDRESVKSVEIDRLGLPAGVTDTCRRRRIPAKRNAADDAQLSVILRTKNVAPVDSTDNLADNEDNTVKAGETFILPKVRETSLNDVAKSTEGSPYNTGDEDNSVKGSKIPEKEKISKSIATKLAQDAESSAVHSDREERSLMPSISVADAPINETEIARALPAEKPSDSIDVSPASLAASLASLDGIPSKPAAISISSSRSAVSSSTTAIEENKLNEDSSYEMNSILINEIDAAPACIKFSADKPSLATSVETLDGAGKNTATLDERKMSLNDELANEAISTISDESPASPDTTQSSHAKVTEIFTSHAMKPEKRLSIYDNVALSIPLEKEDADSTSLSNFTGPTEKVAICNHFFLQDTSNDMPIENPIERSLLAYETNLHDGSKDDHDEFDSRNNVNPQFFIETSATAKKKATRNSDRFVEPINVKELRSRQVLCSPSISASHQNLQRTQSPSIDEALVSSRAHISQRDCHSRVQSLRTLLNHHLGERKKKPATKTTKLRRAAAIKLQETAEKNVKLELVKLVESEEWTSELHQSIIARLLNVRSERTVAKCIVEFLVESASLDEPLDQTYTPPAPIMTRSQQMIATLINSLAREETMPHIFDLVQAGIEYTVFKLGGGVQPIEETEYLVRIFTVISRIRKDRERVRILCCDAFYCLGRKALPVIHVILTIWPEVLPKHGTIGSELANCLAHVIKVELPGKEPLPKVMAVKNMITNYYEYPQFQALSAVVMKVLIKALHEKYSSDLEAAILLVSKREGSKWALDNVIEKGMMKVIQDDSYQWPFEILSLLGFILRCFPTVDTDKTVEKYVDLLCQMLESSEGSQDKQEGIVSALLSLSRYKSQFLKISDSVLKWMPTRELRASTLEQLESFFNVHTATWWNMRLLYKMKRSGDARDKDN